MTKRLERVVAPIMDVCRRLEKNMDDVATAANREPRALPLRALEPSALEPLKRSLSALEPHAAVATAFGQPGQAKKRRTSRAENAGPDQHVQSDDHSNIAMVWTEYSCGLNGGPSLRSLELQGTKWRSYEGGRQKWYNASFLYRAIERRQVAGASEEGAITAVQGLLDQIPKRGKSTKPNFAVLRKQLQLEETAKPGPGQT
jgi:hypothetical protein